MRYEPIEMSGVDPKRTLASIATNLEEHRHPPSESAYIVRGPVAFAMDISLTDVSPASRSA